MATRLDGYHPEAPAVSLDRFIDGAFFMRLRDEFAVMSAAALLEGAHRKCSFNAAPLHAVAIRNQSALDCFDLCR